MKYILAIFALCASVHGAAFNLGTNAISTVYLGTNEVKEIRMGTNLVWSGDVTAGLVGWWKFDGNAMDSSGYGNNGVVSNATLVTGRIGQAYEFANSNAMIDFGNGPSLSNVTRGVSVAYWWQNTGTNNQYALIVSKGYAPSGVGASWSAAKGSGSRGYFFVRKADDPGYSYPGNWPAVASGAWVHHTHIVDTNNSLLLTFVNGQLSLTNAWTNGLRVGYAPVRCGGGSTAGNPSMWFNGTIDDVRIYNRALTSNEVYKIWSRAQ